MQNEGASYGSPGARSSSSECSLRLFFDAVLGFSGDLGSRNCVGVVWHRWSRTVSWLDFSGMSSETTDRILYVLAVLAPLSSPAWGVHMSYQLGNGEEFNPVGLLGPWITWGVPVALGFCGFILLKASMLRMCLRGGTSIEPSLAEKSQCVNAVLEHSYRHNDGDGNLYRFRTPYLGFLLMVVSLVLLTVFVVWALSVPDTIGWFVVLEIILSLLVFADCYVVLSGMPDLLILLRLERLYGWPAGPLGSVVPGVCGVPSGLCSGAVVGSVVGAPVSGDAVRGGVGGRGGVVSM